MSIIMNKGYFDIHTHILPGVDDGSTDFDTSIEMLKMASIHGTGSVFLTPHFKRRYFYGSAEEIKKSFRDFKSRAEKEVPVELYLGSEIMYEIDLQEKLEAGEVLTMANTAFVLLEFVPSAPFRYMINGLFDLINVGYIPILAHVERYRCLNWGYLEELKRLGVRMQMNAGGITGDHGFRKKQLCRKMLKKDLIDFIASDAHDLKLRKCELDKCAAVIEKKFGKERADSLMWKNASLIIHSNDEGEG